MKQLLSILLALTLLSGVTCGQSITTSSPNYDRTFYAERYGAKTGDTTDDRAGLQAAVDAAYTAGGGVVQLKYGTYYVNENGSGIGLLLKTGVTLRGAGKNVTYITTNPKLATGNYNVVAPFNFHTVSNAPYTAHELAVEDITFYSQTENYLISAVAATDVVTSSNGALTLGDSVKLLSVTGGAGLTAGTTYYARAVSGSTFKLATTNSDGTIVDITSDIAADAGTLARSRLHNFIACVNTPLATIRRCGFGTTRGHFAEFNGAKNCLVEDCSTELGGFAAIAKFQIDNGGNAGPARAVAAKNTAITGSATYATGTQTLLTVTSTTGFNPGDYILITSANGASAATYNAVGGYRVTSVVSGTTIAIELAWPGNATTAGTLTATIPNENITINRYLDKAPTEGTSEDITVRNFLDLSHTNLTGITRNVALTNSIIVPYICAGTIASGQTRAIIGFDSAAEPLEFTGLKILNNRFVDGGMTGNTMLISLGDANYSSSYPLRKISGVEISGNETHNCGFLYFVQAGDINADSTVRTSIAATALQTWRDIKVERNVVQPILRSGATSYSRATRCFAMGAAEKATFRNNRVYFPNVAPAGVAAWASSTSSNYGFFFDHVRDLTVQDNEVEVALTEGNAFLYLFAYNFGCSAFELAASGPMRANQVWINNSVTGTGTINGGIKRGFSEVLTAGTTGVSSWASSTAPSVSGIWRGNRVTTPGAGLIADLCYGNLFLNVGTANITSTTATTVANSEAPSGTNWGRHRWGYGPRTGTATLVGGTIAVADTAITANTIINVQRVTAGGTLGYLTITRSNGVSFTVTSTSGTDTSVLAYTINEPN